MDKITSSPIFALVLVAVLVLGVYFLMRSKTNRIVKYDVSTLTMVVILGAILVFINAIPVTLHELTLGSVHIPLEGRKDFTANQRNSISDDTVKQLRNLNEDVTATALCRHPSPDEKTIQDLFDQYEFYSTHFHGKFVDPVQDREHALQYQSQLRLIDPRGQAMISPGTVILEMAQPEGATPRRVSVQLPLAGKPGDAEQKLTNALFQLEKKDKTQAYFLTGHGEITPDNPQSGLDKVKEVLQDSMFDIKTVSLLKEGKVPTDDGVVIICGPQKDYEKPDLDILRNYVNGGGRLCALIDPTTVCPNLQAFLAEYGCDLGNDIVLDIKHGWNGQALFPAVASFSTSSPITSGYDIPCYFPEVRSVKATAKPPATVSTSIIASTLPDTSFAVKFDPAKPPDHLTPDPQHDQKGPIGVCMSAVYKPAAPSPSPSSGPSASPSASPTPTPREGRIVLYGGSGLIREKMYMLLGNGDLFMRSINWLAEAKGVDISSHAVLTNKPLILNETQKWRVWWIAMFLIPGTIAMCGLLVHMAFKPN